MTKKFILSKFTTLHPEQIDRTVHQVMASFKIEGMHIDEEDKASARKTLCGAVSCDEMVESVLSRYESTRKF